MRVFIQYFNTFDDQAYIHARSLICPSLDFLDSENRMRYNLLAFCVAGDDGLQDERRAPDTLVLSEPFLSWLLLDLHIKEPFVDLYAR